MPTDALTLKTRYQALVAPGNDTAFFRLLTEADERLLFGGRWHWAREALSLTVSDNLVTLPDAYHSIVGARINGTAVGVNWQESEWFEGGPGEFIPIDGAKAFLVDQGLVDVTTLVDDVEVVTPIRTFKVTSSNDEILTVDVLARFKPELIEDETGSARCPLPSALKQMMYAIVYEEANDTKLSEDYRAKALRELSEHEAAYRGTAKRIYKPSMTRPPRRASRSNFP